MAASIPAVSVTIIDWACTGCTDSAKPATKPVAGPGSDQRATRDLGFLPEVVESIHPSCSSHECRPAAGLPGLNCESCPAKRRAPALVAARDFRGN